MLTSSCQKKRMATRNVCRVGLLVFSVMLFVEQPYLSAEVPFKKAEQNARQSQRAFRAIDRVFQAILKKADPHFGLLPDNFHPGLGEERIYKPKNAGADLFPYLVLASYFLHQDLYKGRILEMLQAERNFASVNSIPCELNLESRHCGAPTIFGMAEYAKDGLIAVTEALGITPWYTRMHEMLLAWMDHGDLAKNTEINGDLLQVFGRMYLLSGDKRYLEWGRKITEAYLFEALPKNNFLPPPFWNFKKKQLIGEPISRLRDHGNEMIMGLSLQLVVEHTLKSENEARYLPVVKMMLERVIDSADSDGLLYNAVNAMTLKPVMEGYADNWGYVYAAVYNMYILTGEVKYREAVLKVMDSITKYKNYTWEGSHYDGFADSIESAIYLLSRVPHAELSRWVDEEIEHLFAAQRPDGHLDYTYLEGNFIRTMLLYALMKTQGVTFVNWQDGVHVGAALEGDELQIFIGHSDPKEKFDGLIKFDYPRHQQIFHLSQNFIRLNELPEWYAVDEEAQYLVINEGIGQANKPSKKYYGTELVKGIPLETGKWVVRRAPAS